MLESLFLIAVGYCIAVLFPLPGVSRFVIDTWARLFKKPTTPPSA